MGKSKRKQSKEQQGTIKSFLTKTPAPPRAQKEPKYSSVVPVKRLRELDIHEYGRFEGADDADKAQRTLDRFSLFVMIQQNKGRVRERPSSLDEVGELALGHVSADGFVGSDLCQNQLSAKPVLLSAIERWTVHYDGPRAVVIIETQQACYRLLQPSPTYTDIWRIFERKLQLTHQVVNLLKQDSVCGLPFTGVMKELLRHDEPKAGEDHMVQDPIFTEEDIYEHGDWIIDQIQNFIVNEHLSNVLLTTPFMQKLMEILQKKEEQEREEAKRKRESEEDWEDDENDPKGKKKGKEKAPMGDEDFEDEPKYKKQKTNANGGRSNDNGVIPSSGFSILSRPNLDMSKHYVHQETELEETKVELVDEFLASETTQGEEFPWRVLSDFTIYDISDDNRICSLDIMLSADLKKKSTNHDEELRASGTAVPYSEEIDEDDEDSSDDEEGDERDEKEDKRKKRQPGFHIALSTIFYWDIYPDGAVWLKTEYAHYKLAEPSDKYENIWRPFLQKYQIAKRIILIMNQDPFISYDKMLEMLSGPFGEFPAFSEKDVIKHIDHIFDEAWGYLDTEDILKFPFFQQLDKKKKGKKGRGKDAARAARVASEAVRRAERGKKLERIPATVTQLIGSIARQLFSEKVLREVKMEAELEAERKLQRMALRHQISPSSESKATSSSSSSSKHEDEEDTNMDTNPRDSASSFSWLGESTQELTRGQKKRTFYDSVRKHSANEKETQGETIKANDFVYINQSGSKVKTNIKLAIPATDVVEGKKCHVYRVISLFEEQPANGSKGIMCIHARRLFKGRETILQEVAGDEELFLSDICETFLVDHLVKKVQVKFMPPAAHEDPTYNEGGTYFYRFYADLETGAFEDARKHEDLPRPDEMENLTIETKYFCHACFSTKKKEQYSKKRWLGSPVKVQDSKEYHDSFIFKGITYYQYDFIYIVPNHMRENIRKENREIPITPYEIYQIKKLWETRGVKCVNLRRLFRFEDLPRKVQANLSQDNRELYWSNDIKQAQLKDLAVEGKCVVKHVFEISDLDTYRLDDWHRFFVRTQYNSSTKSTSDLNSIDVKVADKTLSALEEQANETAFLKKKKKPLMAMDLFAGCGGFTHGLHECEYIKTTHAVEWVGSAVQTFRNNRQDTKVLHGDINTLLKHAIERHDGTGETQLSKESQQLPPKGTIDFIYCGPPCQGFTGMNRFPKADDVLNSLIATTLSCVDFYRPTYFLLENVRGMVDFKLGGIQETKARMSGGIRLGVVKFIVRALTAMGYQARFSLQQAGMYGVPQSRRRFFIWGVLRGHTLPQFPQPTHTFPKPGSLSVLLPNVGVRFDPVTTHSAPHRYTSVGDAISDLPAFEYDEPKLPEDERSRSGAHRGKWIGKEVQTYDAEPKSDFQKAMRRHVKDKKLYNHVTKTFTDMNVKRICNVPKRPPVGQPHPDPEPFYDHRDLPKELSPWCLSDPNSRAAAHRGWPGLYGRLDYQSYFQTALTEVCPMGKQGKVLHPYQSRVITVREHARSQGFPDHFHFHAERDNLKDMHRQIGNAVPPLLGAALGRQLARAIERDEGGAC